MPKIKQKTSEYNVLQYVEEKNDGVVSFGGMQTRGS